MLLRFPRTEVFTFVSLGDGLELAGCSVMTLEGDTASQAELLKSVELYLGES